MSKILHANQGLAKITNDRYRLRYHLMPPGGWMNDPNGLVYYKGEYHVFYQHYPYEPRWGPMHWGHAKSRDLVHWEHLPIALVPSMPYDRGEEPGHGCYSGSAVDDNGVLTLIYTGHVDGNSPVEVQCIARSTDGISFEKVAENPVITEAPDEQYFGFRDPKVWKHGDIWYMVIGYGKDGLGKALLYKSPDLLHWEYAGIVAQSDGQMGDMWECPDLFPIGDANDHVLIFSPMNIAPIKTLYLSGTFDYDQVKFDIVCKDRVDYGFDFYAPQTFLDVRGRRIMFGWMNMWGAKYPEQQDGWVGALTIPREIKRMEDGTLRFSPVEELKGLRGRHVQLSGIRLDADQIVNVSDIRGDALELIAVFSVEGVADRAKFGIRVLSSADDRQYTEIAYDVAASQLLMDREYSGAGDGGVSVAPLEVMADGRVKLHVYVDRSSVELFANDGAKTMTNRVYPDSASTAVKLFSFGSEISLESLDVWELRDTMSVKAGQ